MSMRSKIILLITHLICAITCGVAFVGCLIIDPTLVVPIVFAGLTTACWLGCAIIDILEIIEMAEIVTVKCPKCGKKSFFRNWFTWILRSPMHGFGKRYTKCHICGKWSYMKREK